jgi:hypothetical protein
MTPLAATLFPMRHIYDQVIADHDRQHAFVALAAMVISFLAIRTSARMTRAFTWWPGGVETSGGMHLHHFVWGIFLMMGSGFIGIGLHPGEPWGGIVAAVFGVGAGFTLDEFALWTSMQDVYWSEQGRSSLEAVTLVSLVGLLVVVGVRPFSLEDPASATALSATIALTLAVAIVALLKGRILLGTLGLFVLPVGLVGALRLAHPRSPWARRWYPPDGERYKRACARFDDPTRVEARLARGLENAIGGRPSSPDPTAAAAESSGVERGSGS